MGTSALVAIPMVVSPPYAPTPIFGPKLIHMPMTSPHSTQSSEAHGTSLPKWLAPMPSIEGALSSRIPAGPILGGTPSAPNLSPAPEPLVSTQCRPMVSPNQTLLLAYPSLDLYPGSWDPGMGHVSSTSHPSGFGHNIPVPYKQSHVRYTIIRPCIRAMHNHSK